MEENEGLKAEVRELQREIEEMQVNECHRQYFFIDIIVIIFI